MHSWRKGNDLQYHRSRIRVGRRIADNRTPYGVWRDRKDLSSPVPGLDIWTYPHHDRVGDGVDRTDGTVWTDPKKHRRGMNRSGDCTNRCTMRDIQIRRAIALELRRSPEDGTSANLDDWAVRKVVAAPRKQPDGRYHRQSQESPTSRHDPNHTGPPMCCVGSPTFATAQQKLVDGGRRAEPGVRVRRPRGLSRSHQLRPKDRFGIWPGDQPGQATPREAGGPPDRRTEPVRGWPPMNTIRRLPRLVKRSLGNSMVDGGTGRGPRAAIREGG
jgi:hypothetical protein